MSNNTELKENIKQLQNKTGSLSKEIKGKFEHVDKLINNQNKTVCCKNYPNSLQKYCIYVLRSFYLLKIVYIFHLTVYMILGCYTLNIRFYRLKKFL